MSQFFFGHWLPADPALAMSGGKSGAARSDLDESLYEIAAGPAFEDVAKSSKGNCRTHKFRILVNRIEDGLRGATRRSQAADHLETVQVAERDVEQDNLGTQRECRAQRRFRIAESTHDMKMGLERVLGELQEVGIVVK